MLIEVDSDREQAADRDMRVRRKNFYRRLGCRELEGVDYILPLASKGQPPEMDLLLHTANKLNKIEVNDLRSWIKTIYTDVYDRSSQDHRIEIMLSSAQNCVQLR
jgi:hypothetical protein